MYEFIPCTPELVQAFYGKSMPQTLRGLALMKGSEVIAIFGLHYHDGAMVLFSNVKPEYRRKRTLSEQKIIVRMMRKALDMIDAMRVPVYSAPDLQIEGAITTLKHMGFRPFGNVYVRD